MRFVLLIRSASLRGFRGLVAELGGDADQLAEAVGLPTAALDSDELMVPTPTQNSLIRRATSELKCPEFGLRLAARQDLTDLGPLGLALRACGTLLEAFNCANRFVELLSPGAVARMEDDPYGISDVAAIGSSPPIFGGHDPGIDAGIGFVHRACISLAGHDYGLRSIEMPFIPAAPPKVYEDFFSAPVNFNRPLPRLRITREGLNRPLTTPGDPRMRLLIERVLQAQLTGSNPRAVAPRVRGIIEAALGVDTVGIAMVARSLAMSPRSLQRRLTSEGTSFTRILDDARRDGAIEYLTTTDLAMSRIAELLGLSEQAALARSTRRWLNATPSEIRRTGSVADSARFPYGP